MRSTKVLRICQVCGNEFRIFRCWLRADNGGKFCSRACQAKGRRPSPNYRVERTCVECGKIFIVKRYRAETAKCCSRPCLAIYRGKLFRGSNHPKWKGGISERLGQERTLIKQALRIKGKCERCGGTENLQGHHLLTRSSSPLFRLSSDNIEILCAACHASEHPIFAPMILRPRIKTGRMQACEICELEFYVMPYKKDARWCSRKCQMQGLPKKPRTGWLQPCETCGKSFYRQRGNLDARFCSKSCVLEWLNKGRYATDQKRE
jgi:hypothetical protein